MTNQDMSANPRVNQWSNGADPAVELNRMMEVRRAALDRFGERNIKLGQPMAMMEEVLVPLYLHHRYQVSAAASPLGGIDYIYSLRGDGRTPVEPISREDQMAALDALLATISSDELALPDTVVTMLPPRPTGFGGGRELFPRYTGSSFDVITPAVVAADHTVSEILNGQRAARLVQQHAVTESLGLGHRHLGQLLLFIPAVLHLQLGLPSVIGPLIEKLVVRAARQLLDDRVEILGHDAVESVPLHVGGYAAAKELVSQLRSQHAEEPTTLGISAIVELVFGIAVIAAKCSQSEQ